jgi:WD40 repeat protein/serine/threonine protein kinase
MSLHSVADLIQILRQQRLLQPAQEDELGRDSSNQFPDARALAKELVRRGWLTPYQVNQIFRDRAHELLLGSYVLLEKLGEGGMGAVFQARNWKLGQVVALKLIRPERLGSADTVKRFQREIRAAAQLNHPHIVQALDADEVRGTHFLVMEYVEGTPLNRLVKQRGPLPVAEACEYVRQAALGLQHAFERGLIHRDIKPGNILLASPGAVVKVLDLGLARLSDEVRSEESSTLTQEGAVMGTPDFMAPEQTLDSHLVDIRSDLYSLGCTLYFLLTGRVPFPGGSLGEKIARHQLREPEAVETRRPDVPPAVAGLVRQLMAKDPAQRFQTPAELANALGIILKEQQARVTPVASPTLSGTRSLPGAAANPFAGLDWSDTTPAAATPQPERRPPRPRSLPPLLMASGVVAGLLLLGGLWLGYRSLFGSGQGTPVAATTAPQTSPRQPTPQELEAQWREEREKEAAGPLEELRHKANDPKADFVTLAQEVAAFKAKYGGTPQAVQAAELLMKLPSPLDQLDPTKIPGDAKAAWKASGFDGKDVVAVLGEHRRRHWGGINCLAVSPNGKLLATGGFDRVIRIWDAADLRERFVIRPGGGTIINVVFLPNSAQLLSDGGQGTFELWDVETGKSVRKFEGHSNSIYGLAISPDGAQALSGGEDKTLRLWSVDSGKELARFEGHTTEVTAVAFSPDRQHVLSAGNRLDSVIRIWDLPTRKQVRSLGGDQDGFRRAKYSGDGDRIIASGFNHQVRIWDAKTGNELHKLSHGADVIPAEFLGDKNHVISAEARGFVCLWNLENDKEIRRFPVGWLQDMALTSVGRQLVIGHTDGTVRLWDVDTGKEVDPLTGPTGAIHGLAFASDEIRVFAGGQDGKIRQWDLKLLKEMSILPTSNTIHSLALSPDDRYLVSGTSDPWIRRWDLLAGKELPVIGGGGNATPAAAISPDGRIVVSGSHDSTLKLWELATGRELHKLIGHKGGIFVAAFAPDGRMAGSGSEDRTVRLWDAVTGKEIRCFTKHETAAWSVAFSPDSKRIAAACSDTTVRVWELGGDAADQPMSLRAHTKDPQGVVFSPDGKTLASAGLDGRIILWDASSRAKLREWQLPGPVHGLAFATDGRHFATANGNGTVYLLRLGEAPAPGQK